MKAQMKIQQMAFMIIAVFFFFVLVGLFVLRIQFSGIEKGYDTLQRERAIASLESIANMPEFSCGSRESWCLDEDRVRSMSGSFGEDYKLFFGSISSIEVVKLEVSPGEKKVCPSLGCNYYSIYDSGQEAFTKYPAYVSLCSTSRKEGYTYDTCEIAKLLVGVKNG